MYHLILDFLIQGSLRNHQRAVQAFVVEHEAGHTKTAKNVGVATDKIVALCLHISRR